VGKVWKSYEKNVEKIEKGKVWKKFGKNVRKTL
jgi:hypothetical protein